MSISALSLSAYPSGNSELSFQLNVTGFSSFIKLKPMSVDSILVFLCKSELLVNDALEVKVFDTTFPLLPKLKVLPLPEISCPITMVFETEASPVAVSKPTQTLKSPDSQILPESYPTKVFLCPDVLSCPAMFPSHDLLVMRL